jgi:hypothetical protein
MLNNVWDALVKHAKKNIKIIMIREHFTISRYWIHNFQEKISIIISLTSESGALFNIFLIILLKYEGEGVQKLSKIGCRSIFSLSILYKFYKINLVAKDIILLQTPCLGESKFYVFESKFEHQTPHLFIDFRIFLSSHFLSFKTNGS